jgi:hypothetical protein
MHTATRSQTILRTIVLALFVVAMAALVLAFIFGFERPDGTLLLFAALLLVAAIASVFIHLGVTDALDREQKRSWLRRLTGRHALAAWSDYLSDTRD